MPHSVAAEQDLHCLHTTQKRIAGVKGLMCKNCCGVMLICCSHAHCAFGVFCYHVKLASIVFFSFFDCHAELAPVYI